MPYVSINPANNRILKTFLSWDNQQLAMSLEQAHAAHRAWSTTSFSERAAKMKAAASELRHKRDYYATLITQEMGKLLREARGEIEKCALACDYYAENAEQFLKDEPIESDAGRSYVAYQPMGTLLAVMPWNFPFWQVFRAAAPALMAGNACVLKHSSNVPQCALAIEEVFRIAGFPEYLFKTLMVESSQVSDAIADPHVNAITLTGSEAAGRKVAAAAGQCLKKCVLELGGSDAFVVLRDADLELTVSQAVAARYLNAGQSCIAAKRFILVPEIAEDFLSLFKQKVASMKIGDPMEESTQLGPMARPDLLEELHKQVSDSIAQGAVPLVGCAPIEREGAYYAASILDKVTPKIRAYHEELFGPVAIVIRANDEADALRIANDTPFGLGSSVWSTDITRAEKLAKQLQAGCSFINGMVKSDPRLPFGGTKASGFGRELSYHGIKEFTNVKTVWIR